MNTKQIIYSVLGILACFSTPIEAAYTMKDGQMVNVNDVARSSVDEHYRLGSKAFNEENWYEAVKQFHIIALNFSNTSYGQDVKFFLGVSNYYLAEYDIANEILTDYLESQSNPRYFQETIEYKFAIAEHFRCGAKRRYWGTKQMPKWASGEPMAPDIYDQVIASMPNSDLAAKALFSKACLLWKGQQFHESVDLFQMVIRRFPKNELAPESYLRICKLYLEQCKREFQNPDLLAFAQINLRRFHEDFPREERFDEAEHVVLEIQEICAKGLFDTAQFYERTYHPNAAVLYYRKALQEFPETSFAMRSKNRLARICPSALDVPSPEEDITGVPDNIKLSSLD